MAAKEVKKATDNLSCPVCYQLFKNPKYLPCHHSYCEECLEKMQVGSKITCPECRREAAVPAGGVKDFDNAFFINRMVDEFVLKRKVEGEAEVKCDECDEDELVVGYCPDCNLFFCHICNESHKRSKRYRGHGIVPLAELKSNKDVSIQPKPKVPVCREHEYDLKHYCESCDVLVCLYCTMKEHNGHDHDTVKKVADKHRKQLKEITAPVDEMIRGLAETHNNIDDTRKKMRKLGEETNKEIDQHYDVVIQQLMDQRDQLKQQVHNTLSQEEKGITARLEEVECAQAESMSMKELNDALEKSSDQEVFSAKKQITDRMQQLTNKYNSLKTQKIVRAAIGFIPSKQPFPQFGLLCSTAKPDPHKCEVDDIPGNSLAGKEVQFTIITKDDRVCRCYQESNTVGVQLEGVISATIKIEDNGDGSYVASFIAQQVGQVKVSVLVNQEHIRGSPYSIALRRHYTSVSKPSKIVNNSGTMGSPWGIGFSRNGKWAVADFSSHCVHLYNSEDQLVKKIGDNKGSNNGQFSGPEGIAFDDNNCLYVADCVNHRVQKFNSNGDYVLQFGFLGSDNCQLKYPKGLIVHNGKVYVADYSNGRISVFLTNGTFHQIIGKQQLRSPHDVAITSNDELLVVDCTHNFIYRFTVDGDFIGKFSSSGADKGQLDSPYSIVADPNDFILVADSSNDRVSVFDRYGHHIHSFGTTGTGLGEFARPYGVAVNRKGDIYVSDHNNKRIQIFSDW